ncbi:hypothetical protein PCCS19_36460 [Paenibacillus sp. CCS19]|uniref:DUF1885 family protein n=1 Tax=Paenibacillus sp. CCS19 TaxID=3158387 RepID=UPI00256AB0A8|nr:DUF1885 family protein [Paenibacillus cellulosilyticus]GMK40590.1 hypothetical protein PCCS19_36460 [Paenibacillus cellulosilyticus]
MGNHAYIRLVQGSAAPSGITLEELEQSLEQYQDALKRTGHQLNWEYEEAAFPYTIEKVTEPSSSEPTWLYLRGNASRYRHIALSTAPVNEQTEESCPTVQIVLPDGATHGDKGKANELCRFIAQRLKAELTLFNGRVMYFNPRK